jgi:PAS domain S-box-containing protein
MARILIVDDDPASRELLVTLVRYKGHEALEATDGAEALDIVRARRPQLVISDILMPTMDGYEFVRRLRGDSELTGTGVIFYTASYHQKEAHQLANTGRVSRVLVKPCEPSEILRAVDEVLSGTPGIAGTGVPDEFDAERLRLLTDKLRQRTSVLEAANARLTALLDLQVKLTSERDPRLLLEQVCHGARRLFGAKYAVLAARNKAANGQSFFAISGLDFAGTQPERPSLDSGPLGRIAATGKPWRAARNDGATIEAGLPRGYPRAHAFLAVPLIAPTRVYGWICLTDKIGADAFSDEDERLLAILGAQVGRIYESGILYIDLQLHARQLQQEIDERERMVAGLQASEERFRQLAENIQDAFFMASSDLKDLIYLSPAYSQIWGQSNPGATSCADILMEAIHPDDAERVSSEFRKIAGGQPESEMEFRIVRPDGAIRWILLRTFPVLDADSESSRVVGTAKDVTQHRRAAARFEQLNRVDAVLRSIKALLVPVASRDELFNEACRLAVEFGQFALAWIGWLNPDTGEVHTIASAGAGDDLVGKACPKLAPDPADDGFVAIALRSRQPQVSNDLKSEHRRIALRDEMLKRGYHSLIALPLVIDGASVGCLVLAAREAGFFTADALRPLTELAGDITFALHHIVRPEPSVVPG